MLPRFGSRFRARTHPRSILMPEINSKQCFLLSPATTREQQAANVNRASIQMRRLELKQHAPLFHFTVVRNEINFHSQLVLKQTRSKTLRLQKTTNCNEGVHFLCTLFFGTSCLLFMLVKEINYTGIVNFCFWIQADQGFKQVLLLRWCKIYLIEFLKSIQNLLKISATIFFG